jgi:hypothetical protein
MNDSEILVVLAPGEMPPTGLRVVQTISPTVMIAELPPGAAIPDPLRAAATYVGTDPPAGVLANLDETERLFVSGWLARQSRDKSARPGEGLPWDAAGMIPPDLPPK